MFPLLPSSTAVVVLVLLPKVDVRLLESVVLGVVSLEAASALNGLQGLFVVTFSLLSKLDPIFSLL